MNDGVPSDKAEARGGGDGRSLSVRNVESVDRDLSGLDRPATQRPAATHDDHDTSFGEPADLSPAETLDAFDASRRVDRGAPADESRRPAESRFTPGDRIDRYVVIARIGAGAMGVVFAAYDPQLDRKVAVKILSTATRELDDERKEELIGEAQAMAKVHHPNVVSVFDAGSYEDSVYIAMELVDGVTLTQWLKREPRSWRRVLAVFLQAGRGLAAAHQQGLVHRDFKPDNVLIGAEDRTVVGDFGLALPATTSDTSGRSASTLQDPEATASGQATRRRARARALAGTPAYMSPEQFAGTDVDARSDQFSFCVSLYEALYGHRPFEGRNVAEIFIAVAEHKLRKPPPRSRVPGWVHRVLMRGLSHDAAHRFPSINELLAELERDPTRRRIALLAATGVALALAGAILVRVHQQQQIIERCDAQGRELQTLWNDATRVRLRDSLVAQGPEHVAGQVERMLPWIDTFASRWSREREQTCLAHDRDLSLDDTSFQRALACFEEQRVALEVTLAEFTNFRGGDASPLVRLAAGFLEAESCADIEDLLSRPQAPLGGAAQASLAEIRREILRAKVADGLGDRPGAEAALLGARARAQTLGWEPLTAEVSLTAGQQAAERGDYQRADEELGAAFGTALSGHDDVLATRSAISLLRLHGYHLASADRGEIWAKVALGLLSRSDRLGTLDEAAYQSNLGLLLDARGELDAAQRAHERALALRRERLGPDHPECAHSLGNLGSIAAKRGDLQGAHGWHEMALSVRRRALGELSADTARSQHNLALVERRLGALAAAKDHAALAIKTWEQTLGADHPDTARGCRTLGLVLLDQGDPSGATRWLSRAYETQLRRLGGAHAETRATLDALTQLCATAAAPICEQLPARTVTEP